MNKFAREAVKNEYTFTELLNMYIDKILYWNNNIQNENHLIQNLSTSDFDNVMAQCTNKLDPEKIHAHARVKDWLIILNLEKESRNGSTATEKTMET